MNLSYGVSHDELSQTFSRYGEIEDVEIPLRKGGRGHALGIAYISFKSVEEYI